MSVDFDSLLGAPTTFQQMLAERRWVGWKLEMRGDALTKVPVNAATGAYASSSDPSTWASYEEAQAAVERYFLAGAGFQLGGRFGGADLDGPPEWKVTPAAGDEQGRRREEILARTFGDKSVREWLAEIGGYSEWSPNQGAKVIVFGVEENGSDPYKNVPGLEVYKRGRFFTVTRDKIYDGPSNVEAFRALAACRPSRRNDSPAPTASSALGTTAYGRAALDAEFLELARTPQGDRNNALNRSAFAIGQLVAGEQVDESEALHLLWQAARASGLETDEIRRTLERALSDGKAQPRRAPERAPVVQPVATTPAPEAPKPAPPQRDPSSPQRALFALPEMNMQMFHGPAGDYAREVAPHTEAHPVGILASSLVGFGNALGRNAWVPISVRKHYLNDGVLLCGPSAVGRKNEAMDVGLAPVIESELAWSERQLGGFGSGEAVVEEVCDPVTKLKQNSEGEWEMVTVKQGAEDKRLLVVESEFAQILAVAGREGSTYSPLIRNAFDSRKLQNRTRGGGKLVASDAHVSFLTGITPDEFNAMVTSTDIANGTVNRFLLLAVKRLHVLPKAPVVPQTIIERAANKYRDALDYFQQNSGPMKMTEEALDLWAYLYEHVLSVERHGLLGESLTRADVHALRLSAIYAALDKTAMIGVQHLRAAYALWEYAENSARVIFGQAPSESPLGKLLDALAGSESGALTGREAHAVFSNHLSADELDDIIELGVALGLLGRRTRDSGEKGGRPVHVIYVQEPANKPIPGEQTEGSFAEEGFIRGSQEEASAGRLALGQVVYCDLHQKETTVKTIAAGIVYLACSCHFSEEEDA